MKKINIKDLEWEIPSNEDVENPGAWKKVIVKHEDVDSDSKLMMINVARVEVGKTHPAHAHKSMEEIFYFQEGEGEVRVNDETVKVGAGDRIIVPAKSEHEIRNTGEVELKFIGIGIALD